MRVVFVLLFLACSCLAQGFANHQDAFYKVCAYCHKPGGVATPSMMDAADPAAIEDRAEAIRFVVRNGNYAMPAFRASEISDKVLLELSLALARGEFQ